MREHETEQRAEAREVPGVREHDWLDRHCYPWTREDLYFCREHNEHDIKWVKFKGGEIPCSENGCVKGSFLNPTAENPEEPMVQEH